MHFSDYLKALAAAALTFAAAAARPAEPPAEPARQHRSPWPALVSGTSPAEQGSSLDLGPNLERGRSARSELAEIAG